MATNEIIKVMVDTDTMMPVRKKSRAVKELFNKISLDYDLSLCADGSYKDGVASIGITDGDNQWLYRVDNYFDNNIAELMAILQALRLALTEFRYPKRLLIGSDSLAVLSGFLSAKTKNCINQYSVVINFGLSCFYEPCDITLIWIPGHKGIALNHIADRNAKYALQLPQETTLSLPLALWARPTRSKKPNPADTSNRPADRSHRNHAEVDSFLESVKLQISILNCHKQVPGYPQFSWCELCSNGSTVHGHVQTAEHIFFDCCMLEVERAELRTEFVKYGIPFQLGPILDGYCIDQIEMFFIRLKELKAALQNV